MHVFASVMDNIDWRALARYLASGWYIAAATVLMTLTPFLTTLTRNSEGSYSYLALSATFCTEIIKFSLSLIFYLCLPPSQQTHRRLRYGDAVPFATPAFTYFLNNNLIFAILMYVNTTSYQILSSLKTLTTGILFRLVLKRHLSDAQIVSILLLCAGAASSQIPNCPVCIPTNTSGLDPPPMDPQEAWIGVSLTLLACFLSSFAGVYSELLLKKDGEIHSIHLQNMLLYVWGVLFNFVALLLKVPRTCTSPHVYPPIYIPPVCRQCACTPPFSATRRSISYTYSRVALPMPSPPYLLLKVLY